MNAKVTNTGIDNSGSLFDHLLKEINKKADCYLTKVTGLPPSAISKIRNGYANVSAQAIITIHKTTGIPILDIERKLPKKPEPVKRAKKVA